MESAFTMAEHFAPPSRVNRCLGVPFTFPKGKEWTKPGDNKTDQNRSCQARRFPQDAGVFDKPPEQEVIIGYLPGGGEMLMIGTRLERMACDVSNSFGKDRRCGWLCMLLPLELRAAE